MKYYDLTTAEDTVPASSAITGTVSCSANSIRLTGSGTAFLSEIRRGDAIFDDANDEIRMVATVQSNTELILERGFTNALSGATVKLSKFGSQHIAVRASGDVTIIDKYDNSATLLNGDSLNIPVQPNGLVQPIIVDPGANTAKILIQETNT